MAGRDLPLRGFFEMPYIIDGYNLLHQTNFSDRDQLIAQLVKFCQANNKTAQVVFDGLANPEFVSTRVQVIFAGDADEYISRLLREARNPNFYTLVSSDRELQQVARENRIEFIKVQDFDFTVTPKKKTDDKPVCFLSDDDIEKQLKEFNYFKNKE